MDMAIANLFKHKALFQLTSEENDIYEPCIFNKRRQYRSNVIENLESIGVSNANDLRFKCLEPFIVHIMSTLVKEESDRIDNITATATLMPRDGEYDDYDFVEYSLFNPEYCLHLFSAANDTIIYSFPEHLLTTPFSIFVNVYSYFVSDEQRDYLFRMEMASRQEAPEEYHYAPPDQT